MVVGNGNEIVGTGGRIAPPADTDLAGSVQGKTYRPVVPVTWAVVAALPDKLAVTFLVLECGEILVDRRCRVTGDKNITVTSPLDCEPHGNVREPSAGIINRLPDLCT